MSPTQQGLIVFALTALAIIVAYAATAYIVTTLGN